ncbi:hypothetical protein B0G80_5965 [Paraburkholderia sp. BL6669N2]|nr:hypothetical protein B0G80_5965 [Paraburkholderia sp. BL6669N2]
MFVLNSLLLSKPASIRRAIHITLTQHRMLHWNMWPIAPLLVRELKDRTGRLG